MNHDVFLPTPPPNVIVLMLCGHYGENKVTLPLELRCVAKSSKVSKRRQASKRVATSRTRGFCDRQSNVPERLVLR